MSGRIIVCGAPSAGKSTYASAAARSSGAPLRHLDSLVEHHAWSAQSEAALVWLDAPGPWIIEGCAAVRALRKWLSSRPAPARPCERVVRLTVPRVPLSAGQARLAKGEETIWQQIAPELAARGVEIILPGNAYQLV